MHMEFLIKSGNKDIVLALVGKYIPPLVGMSWQYNNGLLAEISNADWLEGQAPTLALIRARSVVVAAWRKDVAVAIAKIEEELGDV